ncbi:MAG: hypothetical protein PUA81_03950 [Oscillospiraceae bacterium]|nr:hypothetical protein [Oscillospiraceae bacterium]
MRDTLKRGLTYGMVGNLFFIAFSLVCLIYYNIYDPAKISSRIIEMIAYTVETLGFLSLMLGMIDINRSVRMRPMLKFGFPVYILVELVMMILELNSYQIEFYKPYSLLLAVIHAVFSAAVCFTFLSLDPGKSCLEVAVTICFGVILGGMLGNVIGIRIYFSILTNAVAYAGLFSAIRYMYCREMIEIDCHGDKARVAEYDSSFF